MTMMTVNAAEPVPCFCAPPIAALSQERAEVIRIAGTVALIAGVLVLVACVSWWALQVHGSRADQKRSRDGPTVNAAITTVTSHNTGRKVSIIAGLILVMVGASFWLLVWMSAWLGGAP